MIEVFEPGSDEERFLLHCLRTAHEFQNDPVTHPLGVHPTAFIFGRDETFIVNLLHLFDRSLPGGVEAAAECIRRFSKELRATCWALLTDSWAMTADDGHKEAGLDLGQWRQWSEADKERFQFQRREALILLIESRRTGGKQIRQHYRRQNGVCWEDWVVSEGGDPSGRFVGLLPRDDA